ncbi:MAG: imelysin family protein [Parabacteroides sp.]|nr:imelysin family protein [Parabacteroides sp.]
MKKLLLLPVALMSLSLSLFSCSNNDDPTPDPSQDSVSFDNLPADSGNKPTQEQMSKTVAEYVDQVVVPTYKEMLDRMTALHKAITKFYEYNGSDMRTAQNLIDDAADAWRAVREPWEQSEAFLYGVADLGQYDPSLDSWPLDKNGIEQIIKSGDFSKIDGSTEAAQNLRGFHTAEKMLFQDGDSRKADTFTDKNEKTYLKLVADRMLSDTEELYKGWVEGLGSGDVAASYGDAMKKHDGSSAYAGLSSVYQALEMILNGDNGMGGISNEVGTAKIKDPVDAWNSSNKDKNDPNNPGVLAVESWYSWNSLADYENNIVSIKNAYFGGRDKDVESASDNSLHALTKIINPTLDSLMVVQIDATIDAIQQIPAPFRNNLDAQTEINKAIDECAKLTKGLDKVRAKLANAD